MELGKKVKEVCEEKGKARNERDTRRREREVIRWRRERGWGMNGSAAFPEMKKR